MSRPTCANTTHALKKYFDNGIRICKRHFCINASSLPCRLVYEGTWATKRNIIFASVLLSEDSEKSSTLTPDFLQIRQTCWRICLTHVLHKSLQLMEGIDSHIRENTRRLRITGIMTPAVRLHHFRYGT
jgi:hypothetical protein